MISNPSTLGFSFNEIKLTRNGDLLMNDANSTITVTPANMIGDSSAQLCSYGVIEATSVNWMNAFGLCSLDSGLVNLSDTIQIESVKTSIYGKISVRNIKLVNSTLELR